MRKIVASLLLVLALLGTAVGIKLEPGLFAVHAQESQPLEPLNEASALLENETNTIQVIDTYGPSVVAVNVEVRGQMTSPFGQLPDGMEIPEEFRRFFQLPQQQVPSEQDLQEFRPQGSGSGFVISDNGDIITNYHVVQSALAPNSVTPLDDVRLSVVFPSSDEQFLVDVVGVNPLYDIALIRLQDAANLPAEVQPIPLADSDSVRVGQKAIAIGNPFGFSSTVTTGIISAVGRDFPSIGRVTIPMVQTDAAINPGNSGGPLLNSRGELIGMNTAIIPGQGGGFGDRGNIGIGFAVPANFIQNNLADLKSGGFFDIRARPRLGIGIAPIAAFPPEVRDSFNLPASGVAVQNVEPGSAAEKAGLKGGTINVEYDGQTVMLGDRPLVVGGDIIVGVNGSEITDTSELVDMVFDSQAGDTLELTVLRDDKELTIPVTLAVVPTNAQAATSMPEAATGPARLGVNLQDVAAYPETIRDNLSLPAGGAVVVEVAPGSAAEAAGLQGGQFNLEYEGQRYPAGGDIITRADGQAVENAQALIDIVSGKQVGDTLELTLLRDGAEETLEVTLQAAN